MKVLLVDDHPLVLSALQAVIQGIGNDTQVVGVDTAAAARAALRDASDFDLVLLDLALGDADGFDLRADDAVLRFEFPEPVNDADGARQQFIRMARECRTG